MKELIETLGARGELLRIARPADPKHQLAAVTRAVQNAGEEVVLFENVPGYDMPVVSNIYGSHDRLCRMIGAGDGIFSTRWNALTEAAGRAATETCLRPASEAEAAGFVSGPLSALPAITYHARDGGPYFTSAIYLARDPDNGVPNLSFHRSQIISETELRVRLGSSHDLAKYQARAEARNEPLEAALLLSCPPEIFLGACASLPIEASELNLASEIRRAPIAMRRCRTIDLEVPASVDIVVEGRFLPNVKRPEGPFGEFMGNYVEVGDNHVFEVTHVEWRREAVFHSLVCGTPEDLRPLEAVTAARVYRHVSAQVPGVIDVCCRPNVMISIIKIRKAYEGHAQHAILAALGSYLDYNKVVIVVDEDVDIYNLEDVMWAYMTRGRADTRAMILKDIPGFYRDPHKDHWGRLCIDATRPWGREAEFARKTVPGEAEIDLADWLGA
ncbi:UbiD family decarboxylase [Pseudodonghicola flavimaris]|uniref:UbiD family decarboxylase n=1 Tax=Pseudodonghicola flavimaris TaxID=3050036 RepID=A0ABT7F2E0_9RHOB|nr:UbiD family decarboxylase [Pseudodonghicola flavimaris]MDK3018774.1 UbiD family decarboxylase [Pseudodonghicola flavimaris]